SRTCRRSPDLDDGSGDAVCAPRVTATWSEHPEARAEFLDAVAYLADRHLGLADELIDRVESAIEDVVEMPASWPPVRTGRRSRAYAAGRSGRSGTTLSTMS